MKNNLFSLWKSNIVYLKSTVQWRCFMTEVLVKYKTDHRMPRERNWSKNDLDAFTNIWGLEWEECRYFFPRGNPRNLLTEAEDSKVYKLLFSSFLTTSDLGFFLHLKPLWKDCRGLDAKQRLPGDKVTQWYSDLHLFKPFFLF